MNPVIVIIAIVAVLFLVGGGLGYSGHWGGDYGHRYGGGGIGIGGLLLLCLVLWLFGVFR
jgi:hypothetical protein